MRKFLLIQNPGVAPTESYTLLGVGLTRDCGVAGTIGRFESGAKHAITTLLRQGLSPIVYCGKLRLEFFTKNLTVGDELRSKDFAQVYCRIKGEKSDGGSTDTTKELGWTVEMGQDDWTDINMALREFTSNAIDRTIREESAIQEKSDELRAALDKAVEREYYDEAARLRDEIKKACPDGQKPGFQRAIKDGRLSVDIVNENQMRARDGFTRVYIEANENVQRFFGELPVRFLHFSDRPELVDVRILRKGRGLDNTRRALIYKQGVFVRQVETAGGIFGSLFDYNFGPDFRLDESRNASDYDVKDAAAKSLSVADADVLSEVFRSLIAHELSWEATFESYRLSGEYRWDETPEKKKKRTKNWHDGWDKAAGGQTVMCRTGDLATEQVARKGYVRKDIKADNWMQAAEKLEAVPTPKKLLNDHERQGREVLPPTVAAQQAIDEVWGWLETYGDVKGKSKPPVGCFRDSVDAEKRTVGYYHAGEGKVYLEISFADAGVTTDLKRTALEELVHYVTGSTDCSRDHQEYLEDLVVRMMS